jgi:hypothetical protein
LELLVDAVQLPIGFLHSNEQGWTALQPYHLGSFKASKPSDNLSQIDQSNNLDAAKQPSQPTQPTQPTFQVVDAVSSRVAVEIRRFLHSILLNDWLFCQRERFHGDRAETGSPSMMLNEFNYNEFNDDNDA